MTLGVLRRDIKKDRGGDKRTRSEWLKGTVHPKDTQKTKNFHPLKFKSEFFFCGR